MKRLFQMTLIVTFAALTAMANSQQIEIQGYISSYSFAGTSGITFSPTTASSPFDVTTDASGNATVQYGTFNCNFFDCSGGSGDGGTFDMKIDFTVPTGITSGNPVPTEADVTGSYFFLSGGTVSINFSEQTNIPITFSNSNGSGGFTVAFDASDDINLSSGNLSQAGTFHIEGANDPPPPSAPEPQVTILFVTMLGLVGLTTRKKFSRR